MLRGWCVLMVCGVCAGAPAQPPAQPAARPAAKAGAKATLGESVRARIDSALKVLGDSGDFNKAADELRRAFDAVIRWAPASEGSLFTDAAFAVRLVEQVGRLPGERRGPVLAYLRQNGPLARELVFAVQREDDVSQVYAVLEALRAAHGENLASYPALAAAICVVHDRPHHAVATRTKDSPGERIDPAALFGYYARNEGRLLPGLRSLPPEALAYLVDTRASVPELEWALGRHAGNRNVGHCYNDLVYDTAAFKYNKPKKIESMAYSLPNLARVGGVCEEQAYYAAHVARAIGVPAAELYGRSSELAHAWVGFVQQRGSGLVWNMDEGHYDEYEKLRGTTRDPQTGATVDDDRLAFVASGYQQPAAARHGAAALVDGARRLARLRSGKAEPPAAEGALAGALPAARGLDAGSELSLLEAALALQPRSMAAWEALAGAAGGMSDKDRVRWFEFVMAQCGNAHAGFAYRIVAAMAAGVPDPAEQSRVWDWVFARYRQKPDLAGEARIRQGAMWEKEGEKGRAYEAYVDVARQFPNDGVMAVEALDRAEALLSGAKKDGAIVEMYKDAWRRMSRPPTTSPGSFRGSNFYRVGTRYALALEKAGRGGEAEQVKRQLKAGEDKDAK